MGTLRLLLLSVALFASASSLDAGTTGVATDTEYSLRKKDGKTIITSVTTTTIYRKTSGSPGTERVITTVTTQVNDRRNKTSYSETKTTEELMPWKRRRKPRKANDKEATEGK